MKIVRNNLIPVRGLGAADPSGALSVRGDAVTGGGTPGHGHDACHPKARKRFGWPGYA